MNTKEIWYVIKSEYIKERYVGNVSFFGTALFDDLCDLGYKCKWIKGDLFTTCSPVEMESLKSKVNFINGKKSLAETYLKNDYKIITNN